MKQRLIILACAAIGGVIWLGAASALKAGDGGSGLTITMAQSGLVVSLLAVVGFGLPVFGLGMLTSAAGHPLSGMFVMGAALAIVAGQGGPIDDWLRYQAGQGVDGALPGAYRGLAGEVLIWQFLMLAGVYAIYRWRDTLRRMLPSRVKSHVAVMGETLSEVIEHEKTDEAVPAGTLLIDQVGPMCVTAGAAGGLGYLLIRSSDTGQVIWSLILSFTLAALVGQLIFRVKKPVGVFCSPGLLALVAYGLVMMFYHDTPDFLMNWHQLNAGMKIPGGLALVLPIHYMAAGFVGCSLGLGISQAFMHEELVLDEA